MKIPTQFKLMITIGQSQAIWKCKWRHLVAKFVTRSSGAFRWPSFRILTKFQDSDQISGFWLNFRILTKFQDFNQISGFWPNFRILTKFQDFYQIFKISTKYQVFNQISEFWPNFRILISVRGMIQVIESIPWVHRASGNVWAITAIWQLPIKVRGCKIIAHFLAGTWSTTR